MTKFEREYRKGLLKAVEASVDWKFLTKKNKKKYLDKMTANRMKQHRRSMRIVAEARRRLKKALKQ